MASIEITLPKAQFDELALLVSCETLASKGQAKGIERLRGKQVVVVASYGTAERGVIELTAYSVVPLALFTGKTRTHRDKWPEPSYAGMVFRFNGKSFVFTPDRYTIKVSDAGSGQLNLF